MIDNSHRPILVIEDSDEDYEILCHAFKKAKLRTTLYRVMDGTEAVTFLYRREAEEHNRPSLMPQLILLDLNLPGHDGFDILNRLKESPRLGRIPVIIMTSSVNAVDVEQGYQQGVNSYIRKSTDLREFTETIRKLKEFWPLRQYTLNDPFNKCLIPRRILDTHDPGLLR